jgi:hypothetical protein
MATITQQVTNCTGIKEIGSDNLLSIYPNPSNGFVNLNSNEIIRSIQVYDINGRLVYTQSNLNNNTIELNLNQLNNSVYSVKITLISEAVKQSKLVIQK